MRVCKICFEDIKAESLATLLDEDCPICAKCFSSIPRNLRIEKIEDVVTIFLYEYCGSFKDLLLSYKEAYDYELRDVFLYGYRTLLRIAFWGFTLVFAPSTEEAVERRGFDHMPAILESTGMPFLSVFKKISGPEQKTLHKEERIKAGSRIIIENTSSIKGKRILLVDDVLTTGTTLSACLRLLKEAGPKRLAALVLAHGIEKSD